MGIRPERGFPERTWNLARRFDLSPGYDASAIPFIAILMTGPSTEDNLGMTATESLKNAVEAFAGDIPSALWKEMTEHERETFKKTAYSPILS
ncbi:MAG: hypothetical protein ACOX17_00480 [Christensenellales bacterium]